MQPEKRSTVTLANLPTSAPSGVPEWMQKMRDAARAVITQADVEAIVAKQVERAKGGDAGAIKFVFDQVLGGAAFKGATIIQNNTEHRTENHIANHYSPGVDEGGVPDPRKPIRQGASAEERLFITKQRLDLGLPLTNSKDSADRDLS